MKLPFFFLPITLALVMACSKKPVAASQTASSPESSSSSVAAPAASPGITPGSSGSQGGGGNRGDVDQRRQERMTRMKTELGLSEEQQQKIQGIMDQQIASLQAARSEGGTGDREARRTKLREAREAANAQIEALLTPEQKVKWEEMRKQREQEMAARRENRPPRNSGTNAPPP